MMKGNALLSRLKIMSSNVRISKLADLLLSHSLGEDGKVEETKVSKILDDLRQNPPPHHIEILKRFAFLVRRHVSTYQGTLEFMGGDGVEIADRLCQKNFIKGKTTEIKSDESAPLIAGFKLKIGDDVYEDSIANRLNNIRKALL